MQTKLTDRLVNQKTPPDNELWDTVLQGFGMRVGKTKRSYFAMARINGKQVRHTIGSTQTHSLAEAREEARQWLRSPTTKEMRAQIKRAEAREAKRTQDGTFGAVAQRYLNQPRAEGKELRTRAEIERRLRVDIPADWHDRPIGEITRAEIRALFEAKAKKAPVSANRLLGLIKTIFFYALEQDLIDANPAERIKTLDETQRDRVLEDHEIRNFWAGMTDGKTRLDPMLRVALLFLLATGVRRSEGLFATWDEFNFEPGAESWRIPASRSKNRQATTVPLSDLALALLDEAAAMTPTWAESDNVFVNRFGEPLSTYSIGQAMRRSLMLCRLEDNPATPHDLRRTFASNIAKLGFSREVLKRLLNHRERDVTDIYDRHRYDAEARIAMNAWGQRLREITGTIPPASNVVDLPRSA